MNGEIKLAGLEALVPEELEKHLIANLEGARLEIVIYKEAKFCLRIRDSKPSDTGLCEHSDPMDVGAVNSLSRQSKEQGHQVRATGVVSAVKHIFNEIAMQARTLESTRLAKAIKASRGPRVSLQSHAKKRVKRTMENPKGSPKEPKVRSKVPKAQAKIENRKQVS